ncbi:MAG: helix-turn-helix domain-containing protein [Bacteroidota bacterium]|nr:helix-turn-helix domain-containing protein [Bacteroidota bacterium]
MSEKSLNFFGDAENCPVRNVMDRFGDKWSTLVLLLLEDQEVMRFNELHKTIKSVSQKMLSVTLKSLEADGLILRKQYPEIPPRVEYRLSERGQSLIPHIQSLVAWANQHMPEIKKSRASYSS